jgi:Ca-activated chloride channel family protein
MIAEFQFLRPYWLLALAPMLGVWWALWTTQDAGGGLRKVFDAHLLEHLLVGAGQQQRFRPVHGLLLLGVLSVMALSGPSWRKEPSPFADDEAGLFVLLKVSGTMEATDVQPSRLARAKLKLQDLFAQRQGMSTGLIVYSGSAHLVMPLTRDHRIISAMIEDLTPDLMPVEGDALDEALTLATRMLKRAKVAGSLLAMADSVAPSVVQSVGDRRAELPLQFYAIHAPGAPLDGGLQAAAKAWGAPVTPFTIDDTDVSRIAGRAETRFASTLADEAGERRKDSGIALVPFIALCALMWSRRGWVVQ